MNFRLALYYVVQRSDNVLIVPRAPHKDALPLLPLLPLHFFPLLSFSLSLLPSSLYLQVFAPLESSVFHSKE